MISSATTGVLSMIVSFTISATGSDAATLEMVAPANAPCGTRLNSTQSPLRMVILPLSSYLNSVGLTPTETASMTPSDASTNASSPARVLETLAVKYMASALSTRSETKPTACVESWYIYSFGALPSTDKLPGANCTFVPSETVAKVL